MTLHRYDDVVQRTDEWFALRRGIVTASNVGKLITVRKLGALDYPCPSCGAEANGPCLSKRGSEPAPIKTLHAERTPTAALKTTVIEPASNDDSRGLTLSLAAERINERTEPTYTTDAMWRGILEEPIARDLYSQHHAPVAECGFLVKDFGGFKLGLSPDGLVGNDGGIEIKSRGSKKQVQTVLSGTVPPENVAQIQAALLATGRDWWDYVSFSSGMALYVIRVYPDARWHKAITDAVRLFEANVTEQVAIYKDTVRGLPVAELTPDFSGEIRVA